MARAFLIFLARRTILAALLVLLVASAAWLLVQMAPGDAASGFDSDPSAAAVERQRLGLDRPLAAQYGSWLAGALRLELGDSFKYRRPVAQLVAERAANTVLLGACALLLATAVGIPLGVLTGTRQTATAAAGRAASLLVLSIPPLVTSFLLLVLAAGTGWLPVGGFPAPGDPRGLLRYLVVPVVALALPIAASLERLQSQAIAEAMAEPCLLAARARGCPATRLVWRHGLRLSLTPVLGVYGAVVGGTLSGSFAVEIVTAWPGLGALTYEALVSRDLTLVAGCAAAAALFLACGMLAADIALALSDPRVEASA